MTQPLEFRIPRPQPLSYARAALWELAMRELATRYENTLTDTHFTRRRFTEGNK